MISKYRFSLPRLDITGMWVFSLGVWFHIVARLVYSKPWMAFFLAELIAAILVLFGAYQVLMNPLMILVKIIKLRWIHILSYDQMVSRKINNQTTRCANSIFYTTLFTNSAPNYT